MTHFSLEGLREATKEERNLGWLEERNLERTNFLKTEILQFSPAVSVKRNEGELIGWLKVGLGITDNRTKEEEISSVLVSKEMGARKALRQREQLKVVLEEWKRKESEKRVKFGGCGRVSKPLQAAVAVLNAKKGKAQKGVGKVQRLPVRSIWDLEKRVEASDVGKEALVLNYGRTIQRIVLKETMQGWHLGGWRLTRKQGAKKN